MSDLWRDISEEDEVHQLLSTPDRGIVTPPFDALRERQGKRGRPAPAATVAVALVVLAVALAPAVLRSARPAALDPQSEAPAPTATNDPAAGAPSAPDTELQSERDAWARIQAMLPSGPIARPAWLPADIDRTRVELRSLRAGPPGEYEVVYRNLAGTPMLIFRLGPVGILKESGMGFCCVRGTRAVLEFATHLFNDASRSGVRRVLWEEQGFALSISSERVPGEDLLRIAWSLDRETAPSNPYADVRTRVGSCAAAQPEDTVRQLLSLTGSRDRDAVLDCHASDAIATEGLAVASWADLPRALDVTVQRGGEIAGRAWVEAAWTFTSEADGAWGKTNTRFFLLGVDDGAWRVFEVGTAPFVTPP